MNKQNKIDEWRFSGAKAFAATIDADDAVNLSTSYPDLITETGAGGVVRIPATAHGWLGTANIWGKKDNWLVCYIKGTTNYDGLRVVVAVATDSITILAPYVAETFGGTETIQPGFKFDHDVEIVGFDLHLNEASGTAENLTIVKDADAGAAFDDTIYTLAMNTVQNASINFSELSATQANVKARDEITFSWANTNTKTWGLTVRTKRRD